MPAEIWRQNPDRRAGFETAITNKVAQAEAEHEAAIRDRMPGFLRPVMLPLVAWVRRRRRAAWSRRGQAGEAAVTDSLRTLGAGWVVVPDVVVPVSERGMQLDHLVIGPNGLYVVEVKTWRQPARVWGDTWQIREGPQWRTVESPTRQNTWHVRQLKRWLQVNGLPEWAERVEGLVVVLETPRLQIKKPPSMPVYTRVLQAVRDIQQQDRQATDTAEARDRARLQAALGLEPASR